MMGIDLDDASVFIDRFGFNPEDTVTGYIHIEMFNQLFNGLEPKSGDVFGLLYYGIDRPGGRGTKYYQIEKRVDTNIKSGMNAFGRSYVWGVSAKRFNFSYEPNAPIEQKNNQVTDDTLNTTNIEKLIEKFDGLSDEVLKDHSKDYTYSPDKEGREKGITYDPSLDNVYGGYDIDKKDDL
jgi:hypothetical protein